MSSADYRHPYDDLALVKLLFFFLLVLMASVLALATIYPFYLEVPFREVLDNELALVHGFFGDDLTIRVLLRGDGLYDHVFVGTGVEAISYGAFLPAEQEGMERLKEMARFGAVLDNVFDYFLLLSYRIGSLLILGSVAAFFLLAVLGDGLVRRSVRRYSFGDSSVVVNIWARSFAGYALPIFAIVFFLPMSIHPAVIAVGLGVVALSISFFALTLPKLA